MHSRSQQLSICGRNSVVPDREEGAKRSRYPEQTVQRHRGHSACRRPVTRASTQGGNSLSDFWHVTTAHTTLSGALVGLATRVVRSTMLSISRSNYLKERQKLYFRHSCGLARLLHDHPWARMLLRIHVSEQPK
ncbi:hypothetical protein GHK46_28535 [Sinorhizobium medicae]|nr:hypothetical protein [Sinorhizobium medicae]MQW01115.1 hypothetical protein [Sinorhizobium medicae]